MASSKNKVNHSTSSVLSIDDVVPYNFSSRGTVLIKEIIDRRGNYIGIKRMQGLYKPGFPEKIPIHIYIWYPHFFELNKLLQDMISTENLYPKTTKKWFKFVNCICEIDMYERHRVHMDVYSKDCSQCRSYVNDICDKAIWWFNLSDDKFIRMTFKLFLNNDIKFECCSIFIKISGILEVQLEVEGWREGAYIRRSYRFSSPSDAGCGLNKDKDVVNDDKKKNAIDDTISEESQKSFGSSPSDVGCGLDTDKDTVNDDNMCGLEFRLLPIRKN